MEDAAYVERARYASTNFERPEVALRDADCSHDHLAPCPNRFGDHSLANTFPKRTLKMTRPTVIFFGPDGPPSQGAEVREDLNGRDRSH